MTRLLRTAGAAILASAAVMAFAYSATTMTPQQTTHALVGRWTCVTHDSKHRTWRETDTDSMFGSWVRVDSTYPAQNGQRAGTGVGFLGYDAKHHRWIVGSFDTSGDYGISYSNSHAFNGSHWANGYPATGGSTTVMMPNAHEFTVNTTAGSMGSSHQVCTRG